MQDDTDVIIVGAGMVGLWLATLLAELQIQVVVVESKAPPLSWPPAELHARVSAINADLVQQLQARGLLLDTSMQGVSLMRGMRVWESGSESLLQFDAATIAAPYLACIVENRLLVQQLWQSLQSNDHVRFCCPAQPLSLQQDEHSVVCHLSDQVIRGRLLVGCDGAQSWVRQQLPVTVAKRSYQQQALVAVVEAEERHQQLAYQRFLSTGPLGLLPLQHPQQLAMVWSCDQARAETLLASSASSFSMALTNALQCHLSRLTLQTPVKAVPLVAQRVDQAVVGRVVLQGDALQTLHPLAGQGANLGLQDALCLFQQIKSRKADFLANNVERFLQHYQRRRLSQRAQFGTMMRLLCEGFSTDTALERAMHSQGMALLERSSWVKQAMMRVMTGSC